MDKTPFILLYFFYENKNDIVFRADERQHPLIFNTWKVSEILEFIFYYNNSIF